MDRVDEHFARTWRPGVTPPDSLIPTMRTEIERLRAIEDRAINALRGNSSETDEYERGWLDACAEILGRRP